MHKGSQPWSGSCFWQRPKERCTEEITAGSLYKIHFPALRILQLRELLQLRQSGFYRHHRCSKKVSSGHFSSLSLIPCEVLATVRKDFMSLNRYSVKTSINESAVNFIWCLLIPVFENWENYCLLIKCDFTQPCHISSLVVLISHWRTLISFV